MLSNSRIKILFKQGAIKINGKVVTDWRGKLKVGDKVKVGQHTFLTVVHERHSLGIITDMLAKGETERTIK